ncbi:ATP-binding protein [Brevibacillus antibioticus]|uniref:ATP-binding protein n=1 Tax=Brevibacillus antibioticus TaxID=2570228 RepID=A0A4U2Y2Z8_9BACL|nr:AAA family ATPase [Brevibacillus antibioticus]TKI54809.1 ATP-binding protein [Brevibacillus antibioticus]
MLIEYKKSPSFSPPSSPHSQLYLIHDNWNDWREWHTLYTLAYVDKEGTVHYIGGVKIGRFGMSPTINYGRPEIPESFDSLGENFFSLGQDDSYYDNLNNICGEEIRMKVFQALNDIAFYPTLFEKALNERVTMDSLLRGITLTTVMGQFRHMANGGARLTRYRFKYIEPSFEGETPLELDFLVEPESNPPTNIHILIGRNGVGKTRLLTNMINSIITPKPEVYGEFTSKNMYHENIFSNLVAVSFSAFDKTEPLDEQSNKDKGIQYSYVGLKRPKTNGDTYIASPKSPEELQRELITSLMECRVGAKKNRWLNAIEMLETDPVFKEYEFSSLMQMDEPVFKKTAPVLFRKLSSGHAIVLLTITKLVDKVEDRSLVVLDEPEGHLHPPLLSAFTRVLSDLLIKRNGVAIVATHSPVVLQEVPSSCVYILQKTGSESSAHRPDLETFGENVGILTRAVFDLEVTHSGFHQMLSKAVKAFGDYDSVVDYFNDELGLEARAIIRNLLAARRREETDQDA